MKQKTSLSFMGLFVLLLLARPVCCQTAVAALPPAPSTAHSQAPVVYVASTPCTAGTRPLPGIPREAACELMLWKLQLLGDAGKTLSRSAGEVRSGTYVLDCDYGLPRQGTKGLINGGQHLHRDGNWAIVKGKKGDPSAVIYRLDPDKPQEAVSFLRLNANVLHLLDGDQRLMIGTAGWSYSFNSIQP